MNIEELKKAAYPVIPVVVINNLDDAIPLAEALVEGGIKTAEVTLRTPCALDAIHALSNHLPELIVGAGTVLSTTQLDHVRSAGARFAVSPGATHELLSAGVSDTCPLIPGVMTPSEIMTVAKMGYSFVKLFPANAAGGITMLKSLAGPLPDITFCPTGGIGPDNFRDFLQLSNVACVGGSWLVSKELVEAKQWAQIKRLAREASGI